MRIVILAIEKPREGRGDALLDARRRAFLASPELNTLMTVLTARGDNCANAQIKRFHQKKYGTRSHCL
jgi:hypothetical protein